MKTLNITISDETHQKLSGIMLKKHLANQDSAIEWIIKKVAQELLIQ